MNENEPILTLAEIFGFDKQDTPGAVMFRRWRELGVDADDDFHRLDAADVRDRHLWLVHAYQGCVGNGGVHEFFHRPNGEYWLETLEAFQAIGAQGESAALQQVLNLFPGGQPSRDQATRQDQIEAICASLPPRPGCPRAYLDDAITCGWESSDRVDDLLLEYWQRRGPDPK